jgi:hypothetical protein
VIIIIRNKVIKQKDKTCVLTDVAISADGNPTKKGREKKRL